MQTSLLLYDTNRELFVRCLQSDMWFVEARLVGLHRSISVYIGLSQITVTDVSLVKLMINFSRSVETSTFGRE